jgi:hypothetical protein
MSEESDYEEQQRIISTLVWLEVVEENDGEMGELMSQDEMNQ